MPKPLHSFVTVLIACSLLANASGCLQPKSNSLPTGEAVSEVTVDDLRTRLDRALDLVYENRLLSVKDHAAWQVVHGAVAYGRSFPLDKNGEIVSAIDYLLTGGEMNGWSFEPGDMLGERRGLRAVVEPGSKSGQGHYDQWLGYLSGCDIPPDQTIQLAGASYTLSDFIHQIEWDVPRNVDREYSWTLMGLTTYRPTDYQWTASDGEQWDFDRMLRIELDHDLNASACGGAHRLCGLTLALNRRMDQKLPIDGAWKLTKERIDECVALAKSFQNSDGSLSSNYLQRPGRTADLAASLGATGHIFEFVVLAVDDKTIHDDWIKRSAIFLCDAIEHTQDVPLECGALYHAMSGMRIYRTRLFGPRTFSLDSVKPPKPTTEQIDG